MTSSEPPRVAVIDDEPDIVEIFADWLDDEYDVVTATSGNQALKVVDQTVDVVLLDRMMPDMRGDEVLQRLRDRGDEAMVAMVTAVELSEDIIDLPFDEYLTKPINRYEFEPMVRSLVQRSEYSHLRRRSLRLSAKVAAFENTHDDETLQTKDEYQKLKTEFQEVQAAAQQRIESMENSDAISLAYSDI